MTQYSSVPPLSTSYGNMRCCVETTFCNITILYVHAHTELLYSSALCRMKYEYYSLYQINFTNSHFHYTDYILITIWDTKLRTMHMCHCYLCLSFIQLIQPSTRSFIMCIMLQLIFSSSIQRNISK